MPVLARAPLLLLETHSVTRRHLEAFFRNHGLTLTPEIELGSMDLLVELARVGFGIAAVTRNFIKAELQRGDPYELRIDPPIPPHAIGLITLPDMPLSWVAKALLADLQGAFLPD